MKLLITGFGPFPGVRVNPTAGLAAAVARRLGTRAAFAVLPVSYGKARAEFAAHAAAHGADAILMLGLAARSRWVRVERFARLSDSPLHPDADGVGGRPMKRASAMPLRSTAALEPPLAALRRGGLRARLSPSAGRYLCNAVYAEGLTRAEGRPVLFVHVPWPRAHRGPVPVGRTPGWRPRPGQLERALSEIAAQLLAAARRAGMTHSQLA
jgi:pyroglutamyl-peptidase